MSEILQIGNSDAESRWIGIRKHQAVLLLLGVLITGDWCLRSSRSLAELSVGIFLLACAPQSSDGLTNGEWIYLGATYFFRSKWSVVQFSSQKNICELHTKGQTEFSGFSLEHRGRLDLSGGDSSLSTELKEITNSLALRGVKSHVSLHVLCGAEENKTLLCVPADTHVGSSWKANPRLVALLIGTTPSIDVLERWGYTRTKESLVRVLRINDFSQALSNHALLERLQTSEHPLDLSIHYDVLSMEKSQKISSRAVHRISSDSALSHEAGFRRTAQSDRAFKRMRQREILVAQGLPLLRCAVYISVSAPNQRELQKRTREIILIAQDAGLRCQKGLARQAAWFRFQLPGGDGW